MKASKFSDAQKAFIIRQGEEGTSVAEILRDLIESYIVITNYHEDENN